jgi:hypothetical protein
MKKNQIIILISVLLSVAAAVTATILVLKHLKKKAAIAPANLAFENDFSDEDFEEEEIPVEVEV